MGLIARGMKSTGNTSLADGYDVLAAELNTDFDTIVTEINGALDYTNIVAGGINSTALATGIDTAKLDDYSASTTEMKAETNPGVSGSESLPTTLDGELERIRYVLKRHGLGGVALHNEGAANLSTYWGDHSVRGPNLVRNHSFEVKTTAAGSAPDGWTKLATPTTLTVATTDTSNGVGQCISIVADAATEGIYQTLTGLKKSTLYFVQARYVVTAPAAKAAGILEAARAAGVPAERAGTVTAEATLKIESGPSISVADLRSAHESWFPAYMAGEL